MDSGARGGGLRWPPLVAWVWLVYLAGIPLSLWTEHASAARATLELAGVVAFLVLYLVVFQVCRWQALAPIAGMFVLGAALTPSDGASIVYFIFGASFFGWKFREASLAYRLLGGYLALVLTYGWIAHLPFSEAASALVFSALIGFMQVQFGRDQREADRLRLAYDEVERLSKVAERERIARDLHDVLGHTLSLIVLKSELAAKLAPSDPLRAAGEIREVERVARAALADVRDAVAGYRGAGVAAELDHAREVFASAGIALECDASDLRLPAHCEGVLALAIRESVTNVVRHAGARTVHLVVRKENGGCRFEIRDDGRGKDGPEGAGLRGMRERVEALGGVFERKIDGGTRLVVSLPFGSVS